MHESLLLRMSSNKTSVLFFVPIHSITSFTEEVALDNGFVYPLGFTKLEFKKEANLLSLIRDQEVL